MPAAVMAEPQAVRVVELPVPEEVAGHVLVETAFVGLCGTDAELFLGSSTYLQQGLTRYPFVFGHEWSGTVLAVGPDVVGVAPGDRVVGDPFITCGACSMCRAGRRNLCSRRSEMGVRGNYPGAASRYVRVPAAVVTKVPPEVDLLEAPLVEPFVTVLHAVERVRVRDDDRVAVVGTGTLGLLAVQAARASGARVEAVGIDPAGMALAVELGAERAVHAEEIEEDAYSVVLEVSGSPDAAALVPRLLAPGGRAALVGIPSRPADAFATSLLTLKDAEVHGVLGGVRNFERAVRLFAAGGIAARALVDRTLRAAAAPDAFELLVGGARERPKLLLELGSDAAFSVS
jgi:2-desacetyl-2-hydroxyethyl bacteriochlorophyllide A dehydrogenase